jgi:4-hydroxy-tetrahydrodipicolinate reductase
MAGLNIGVLGCGGRMGRALLNQITAASDTTISGGTELQGSDWIGRDLGDITGLGPVGIDVTSDTASLFQASDAIIDFTAPSTSQNHAGLAARTATPLVIGTTGLDPAAQAALEQAATQAAIVSAANMSLGVNLLVSLARRAAATLDDLYDVEISDIHHRHKVDAPSGTALALGQAVADGRGVDHDAMAVRGRDGVTGERKAGQIGYGVFRAGNVVGEHSVIFAANDERIELTHKAGSRDIFARGALTAVRWLQGRPPGLYGMEDVLGLAD